MWRRCASHVFLINKSEYLVDICMNIFQKASEQIKTSWTRIQKISPTDSFHLFDQKCSLLEAFKRFISVFSLFLTCFTPSGLFQNCHFWHFKPQTHIETCFSAFGNLSDLFITTTGSFYHSLTLVQCLMNLNLTNTFKADI